MYRPNSSKFVQICPNELIESWYDYIIKFYFIEIKKKTKYVSSKFVQIRPNSSKRIDRILGMIIL